MIRKSLVYRARTCPYYEGKLSGYIRGQALLVADEIG